MTRDGAPIEPYHDSIVGSAGGSSRCGREMGGDKRSMESTIPLATRIAARGSSG